MFEVDRKWPAYRQDPWHWFVLPLVPLALRKRFV
jgi:hypothetical protein